MFSALKHAVTQRADRFSLQANLFAGITVGIIALPLSMALAIASGVAPQHGLYTAIVAGIVTALSGGSNVNISGPTAAFVVILLPIVQQFGLSGLLISGLMAGIILLLMGGFKFGQLIELIPYPVIIGFTAGIAVVIGSLQLNDFLGLDAHTTNVHFIDKFSAIILALPNMRWQEMFIGSITLGILMLWPKLKSKIPAHLAALFISALLTLLIHRSMPNFEVATIASRFNYHIIPYSGHGIPPFLPHFQWPWLWPDAQGQTIPFSFGLIQQLIAPAITIAILCALESLLCAVVADGMTGNKHNPNDELIGQGLGNIVAPLFGGIPATAAIARTAANVRAGATTPLAAVIHSLVIMLSIIVLARFLGYIPMAAMAALLMMVAWHMSEFGHFFYTLKIAPRDDVLILLCCFLLTILFDMTLAVGVGMGLAALLFIRKSIDLTESNIRINSSTESTHSFPHYVAVYEINGPLFFGSAQKALRNITQIATDVRILILDMHRVPMLDMSAIMAIKAIIKNLDTHHVALIINQLPANLIHVLKNAHVHSSFHEIQFTHSINQASESAHTIYVHTHTTHQS